MPVTAHGSRDADGHWVADDPGAYPAMDVHGTLPWSVLRQDSRPWQERKRWWTERGVDDTTSRAQAAGMMTTGRHGILSGGVSRFDPHLAEVCLRWFCPPGGHVLDPMAGGPVRGIVAGHLGCPYLGVDLSAAAVAANRAVADRWSAAGELTARPEWVVGDALDVLDDVSPESADYALACPPYWNRERYSGDPRDLSAMTWPDFLDAHARIAAATVRALRPDRFLTWVISDVRDHRGHLRSLPALVTDQLRAAGADLIGEQVLVSPVGTAHKRMRPPWQACRTVTRVHQLVLTLVKGDRREAARAARGQ